MLRRVVRVVTVTCLAFLAVGTPAEAQRGGGPPSPPVVLSASPNVPAGTLSIAGTNFGTAPTVVLGGSPLTLISGTNTNIVAVLPSLLPQDYQLTVTNPSTALSVNFSLTIEAGDITRVIAGIGLSGGATTGDATVAVDTAQIQKRITGSCPAGSAIQSVDAGGNVTCETDDVGGGGGATLGANTFTGTQTIDSGNIDLDTSTATAGNITKNGTRFLHNFPGGNLFLGLSAGNFTMSGVGANTGIGTTTLFNNTTGNNNTALGQAALTRNTSGSQNTAVGHLALFNNDTGANNVAFGSSAGFNATGSNNIYLGAGVDGVAGEFNSMYLGKVGSHTKTVIAGVRGTSVTGAETVVIDATGRLGSAPIGAGTDTVGSAQVIDDSLTSSDLAANAVTASELASDSVTADKVAFNYAAGAAEAGAALDVACVGCVAASEVGFTFASLGANTFTGTQTIDAGNLDLDGSAATTGNITKNGTPFLHSFGTDNTFLGLNAGNFSMTGNSNTAVGINALSSITSGNYNTAMGTRALRLNISGSFNTAYGYEALERSTGGENTAVGQIALNSNTSGSSNTGVGTRALLSNETGSYNVAVGIMAGYTTTGSNNIYLGSNVRDAVAGESNTMRLGNTNSALGAVVTKAVIAGVRGTTVTGGEMVVVDADGRFGSAPAGGGTDTVGSAQVIDDSLTASDLAANSVTASELSADSVTADKMAFNYAAGTAEGGAALDLACLGCVAANEVSFSFATLGANSFTATQTIDAGNLDLDASTAAAGNIMKDGERFIHNFGPFASNTFVGRRAGNFTTTGLGGNTGVGVDVMTTNTTGRENVGAGVGAMFSNTTGSFNAVLGSQALVSNTSGSFNTAIGQAALAANAIGSQNVALGYRAGLNATGSNNIYLGAGVQGAAGESGTIYLGAQGVQVRAFIAGIRGTTTLNNDAVPVVIDSAGQLGTVSSSLRFKENINEMAEASRRIFQLRPVQFRYKQAYGDGSKPVQYGLIAEEVAEVFPELAVRNTSGGFDTVHYETLSVLLLNELQKQNAEMERQRQRIEVLEGRLNQLLESRQIQ